MGTAALSTLEIVPGLWLDARRALWLPEHGTLAIADLHLGYAWAHRSSGNMLPITADDGSIPLLRALIDDYQPREVAILGDVIHGFTHASPLRDELRRFVEAIGSRTVLRFVAGNHDAQLGALLAECSLAIAVEPALTLGPHLLLHGHANGGDALPGGCVIFGHEHPLLPLSLGIATTARCPAFLIAEDAVLLPAFSAWAAGTSVRAGKFMGGYAQRATFRTAVAIVAGKLLPVRL